MQDLAGVGARGEQRVLAALARVTKRRTLLLVAVHLGDERVDVDHEPLLTRPSARSPRPRSTLGTRSRWPTCSNVNARQRCRQHDARIRYEPLVVKGDSNPIRRDNHRSVVHHGSVDRG